MLQWAIGRIVAPDQSEEIFRYFLKIQLDPGASEIMGGAQLVVIAAFVLGFRRGVSYAAILLMNSVALAATWRYMIDPYGQFEHRLFWNAVPVVAACLVLFMLRRYDTIASVDSMLDRPSQDKG